MKKPKQLSVIFEDCLESFNNDKPKFLSMPEEHLNIDSLVPLSFSMHFCKSTDRPHGESLSSYILSLIIQRIFSIPSDSLLILFLTYSKDLRDFCGFVKVPVQSQITRFKQDYKEDLKTMFDNLVDLTEPICQNIDSELASMTIFDTSGIEAYVKENNPKSVDALMPTHADAEHAIKQMYINGHFCYSYKFGLITNGLGIVRDIAFYDENYYRDHPEIPVSKKEDSPDEDKSLSDAKALLPTLRDFHGKHPLIKPSVFIGDTAFDSIGVYDGLLGKGGFGYTKAFIPLNSGSNLNYPDCPINEDGIPCCPNDPTLPRSLNQVFHFLVTTYPDSSSSAPRCHGNAKREKMYVEHHMKTLVPIHFADVCYMSIRKRIFVPIREPFAEPRNGSRKIHQSL